MLGKKKYIDSVSVVSNRNCLVWSKTNKKVYRELDRFSLRGFKNSQKCSSLMLSLILRVRKNHSQHFEEELLG